MRTSTIGCLFVFLLCNAVPLLGTGALAVNWDGRLDTSFGTVSGFGLRSGKVVIAYPETGIEPLEIPRANVSKSGQVAVLPDGGLIVGMPLRVTSILWHYGVMRLGSDGTLDTSFGDGGARRLAYQDAAFSHLTDIAVRSTGHILLAGSVRPPNMDSRMAVAQLTSSGDLDQTFGVAGWATVPFGFSLVGASAIAVQADGSILLAGHAGDGNTFQVSMALVRLHPNGQIDSAFGNNGRVLVSLDPHHSAAQATGVRFLDDGGIVLAGWGLTELPGDMMTTSMALVRLQADGSLNANFGDNGVALFNIGPSQQVNTLDLLASVDVQDDGRLIVCGCSGTFVPTHGTMTCLRLLENGQVDPSYATAQINFQLGYPFSQAMHVLIDPQGRALVAGNALRSDDNADFALARLRADGSLDPAFGVGGRVSHDRCPRGTCLASNPNNHDLHNPLFGMALQPDGRIVMAGTAKQSDGSYRVMVTRSHGDRIFAGDHELP